jgi:surfactin synthase thioesterase subunit
MYKIKKKLKCKIDKYGSADFKECRKNMKSFFINVVNTHYNKRITKIRVPILLIYSRKDEKVEFRYARKLHNKLLRSRLRVINGDHFAYLNNEEIVSVEIHDFFKEREKHAYYL